MHSFALPVPTADVTISVLWHPRLDAHPRIAGCGIVSAISARNGAQINQRDSKLAK